MRIDYHKAIQDLNLAVARANLEAALYKAEAAKAMRDREVMMTESVRKVLADVDKATELPRIQA